jgi:hypothetical protein
MTREGVQGEARWWRTAQAGVGRGSLGYFCPMPRAGQN